MRNESLDLNLLAVSIADCLANGKSQTEIDITITLLQMIITCMKNYK